MKVTVSSRSSSIDDVMREDVREIIFIVLRRFSPGIDEVTVKIGEAVGAHCSSQRLCRLSVRMKQLGSFSIESVEDEVMIAASWAAERAAERLQRLLDRQREETR